MPNSHRLTPNKKIRMNDLPTKADQFHSNREQAEREFGELREEFIELQYKLYAEGRRKLLVVLQAMDGGGKDGAIRHVFKGVNPQGVQVTSFKAPSHLELARDYLWRIHKAVPPKGMIGVFNRSQYEDVLIVRVEQLVPEEVWRERYEQINEFERYLTKTGTTILKFFLHISKDEQKERFQARLEDENKRWKFSVEDLEKRKQWDDYMAAYEDALNQCTTKWAPWYAIPSNQKWYRNLAIVRTIVETLRDMKLKMPAAPEGLDKIRVR
jgi:PPK2 family polyphosphate:nucleotide phosphotransferase